MSYSVPGASLKKMLLLGAVVCLCMACNHGDESQINRQAQGFASAYFNWQFVKAVDRCTPESRPWLAYAASQVTQDDVDILRTMSEPAFCEVDHVDYLDGDTTALVHLKVHNFLQMDSIGKAGIVIADARYALPLVKKGARWLVHLTGMLRPRQD